MIQFVVRRSCAAVIAALAASFVIYCAIALSPGDPASTIAGRATSIEVIENIRRELGLDQPLLVRYFWWLINAVRGDLGTSFIFRVPVDDLIANRLPTTFLLVALSATFVAVLGVSSGVLKERVAWLSAPITFLQTFLLSIPSFVKAIVLVAVFARTLHWFPVMGEGSGMVMKLWHLLLPAFTLSLSWSAYISQVTSSSIRAEQSHEFVETAITRGIKQSTVFWRHIFRNSLIPISTASSITLAGLIAGTIVVEKVFGLNGLGSLLVDSVTSRDANVTVAICSLIVVVFLVSNTMSDVINASLDPRYGLQK